MPLSIALLDSDQPELKQVIATLADRLGLPIVKPANSAGFSYCLACSDHNQQPPTLALYAATDLSQPLLCADLDSPDIQKRIRGGRKQLLAKAIGSHRQSKLKVIDTTAGLGRDAATLAAWGCNVHMLERHPVVFALLDNALQRCNAPWSERLSLEHHDATSDLSNKALTAIKADVIYLDPMYVPSKKKALPGKELQVLRALIGEDNDQADLFKRAVNTSVQRIVVKRQPKAAALQCTSIQQPDLVFRGNRARYDVYLRKSHWPKD